MSIGLSYGEVMDMPFSELLDLIAVDQIKQGTAEYKMSVKEEEDDFFNFLKLK